MPRAAIKGVTKSKSHPYSKIDYDQEALDHPKPLKRQAGNVVGQGKQTPIQFPTKPVPDMPGTPPNNPPPTKKPKNPSIPDVELERAQLMRWKETFVPGIGPFPGQPIKMSYISRYPIEYKQQKGWAFLGKVEQYGDYVFRYYFQRPAQFREITFVPRGVFKSSYILGSHVMEQLGATYIKSKGGFFFYQRDLPLLPVDVEGKWIVAGLERMAQHQEAITVNLAAWEKNAILTAEKFVTVSIKLLFPGWATVIVDLIVLTMKMAIINDLFLDVEAYTNVPPEWLPNKPVLLLTNHPLYVENMLKEHEAYLNNVWLLMVSHTTSLAAKIINNLPGSKQTKEKLADFKKQHPRWGNEIDKAQKRFNDAFNSGIKELFN